jgi:hypothetical protein
MTQGSPKSGMLDVTDSRALLSVPPTKVRYVLRYLLTSRTTQPATPHNRPPTKGTSPTSRCYYIARNDSIDTGKTGFYRELTKDLFHLLHRRPGRLHPGDLRDIL